MKRTLSAILLSFCSALLFITVLLSSCVKQAQQVLPEKKHLFTSAKSYHLPIDQPLLIPIADNETQLYQFEANIQTEGLYQLQTNGKADTLCALVQGHGASERYVVVRDTGAQKDNCKLTWAFPAGKYTFKIRVDGQDKFGVLLQKIEWGRIYKKTLLHNKLNEGVVEKVHHRHRFNFELKAPRMVQLSVKGKGTLQCILREETGGWLNTKEFRQQYGSCQTGKWLQAGKYTFDIRSDQKQTHYQFQYQEVRMRNLKVNQVSEGHIQPLTFDLFRLQLEKNQRHVIQTHGLKSLNCQLESPLGNVVKKQSFSKKNKKHGCHLNGQFKPGKYYLRLFTDNVKNSGGSYLVSFRQQKFITLTEKTKKTIQPNFQQPVQLFKVKIEKPHLYQILVLGRSVKCHLQNTQGQAVASMDLSEKNHCLLFANLLSGNYFLRVYPLTRNDKPYSIQIKDYNPPQGNQLLSQNPRLIGPVGPGFRKTFQLTVKRPQLITLETKGKLDTHCSLYDVNNRIVAKDDDSGKRHNCNLTRYLKPGKYKFKIRVTNRSGLFWVQRHVKKLPWVSIGQRMQGSLQEKKKPRTFLLKIDRQGMYGIRTEGKVDTICVLMNEEWRKIARDDDHGEGKNCFLSRFLTKGIYPLRIRMYRHPGKFQLFVYKVKLQSLSLGKKLNGRIKAPHWTDFYRVQIQNPGLFSIGTLGSLDTTCLLLNEQGKRIANNDDAKRGQKNCRIIENLAPGIYFFQVKLYKSKLTNPQAYRVSFQKKRGQTFHLHIDKELRHKLIPDEIIEYHFTIKKVGTYSVQTKGNSDPKCSLYTHSRKKIARDDDNGVKRNCKIQRRFSPGQYIFQIRPASPRNSGRYRVILRQEQ